MVYYDRIDVSEGIDFNTTSESKECDICQYWNFLNCCIIRGISKNEAINLMENADSTEKAEHWKT